LKDFSKLAIKMLSIFHAFVKEVKMIDRSELLELFNKALEFLEKNPKLELSDVKAEDFAKLVLDINESNKELYQMNLKMFKIESKLDEMCLKANEIALRIKKMVSGFYGPNSQEVKDFGLVVSSGRKKPAKKSLEERVKEVTLKAEKLKAKLEEKSKEPK